MPAGKTWDTFEHDGVPIQLRQQIDRSIRRHLSQLTFGSDPVPDGPESIIAVDVDHGMLASYPKAYFMDWRVALRARPTNPHLGRRVPRSARICRTYDQGRAAGRL